VIDAHHACQHDAGRHQGERSRERKRMPTQGHAFPLPPAENLLRKEYPACPKKDRS